MLLQGGTSDAFGGGLVGGIGTRWQRAMAWTSCWWMRGVCRGVFVRFAKKNVHVSRVMWQHWLFILLLRLPVGERGGRRLVAPCIPWCGERR